MHKTQNVITYGTFDLFHEGHVRLLERARSLGDRLIVGVTTDNYDAARGKLNVEQTLMERIENVRRSGLADEVLIEEYEGQKINDIQQYEVDIFAIGSDWEGKFDYLSEYCDVVYLERTKGVSSTLLRSQGTDLIEIGIVGAGRIAERFVSESLFVSGVHVEGVFSRTRERTIDFAERHSLEIAAKSYEELLESCNAIYVATPHTSHYKYAKAALSAGKHVLCEKPITLASSETDELYQLASDRSLVLIEAVKTAYAPGFQRMVALAKSGSIGQVRSVEATFTKLVSGGREMERDGGSILELSSYPLLAILKVLGLNYDEISAMSYKGQTGVDLFSKIDLIYPHAIASARVGIGVKSEGDLVISGTKGYLYAPAPWWKTEHCELRFEDSRENRNFYFKFDGDGLRYEIAEFATMIKNSTFQTYKLSPAESKAITEIQQVALSNARRFGASIESVKV
ncbi:glycerol-3-phosphate cytidylyltransferase [Arthrobacter sp. Soil782]|nr:glycerol-3-phosphate cytidylyltransferase [Arthrobacter sp. Soil782]